MSTAAAPCELLAWDSAHFGFPVARVNGNRLDEQIAAETDAWCAAQGVRCLYLLADESDRETARTAAHHGFRQVDVRRTIRHGLDSLDFPTAPAGLSARFARDDDLPAVAAIAERNHHDSRFYFDGGFPRDRVDALYRAWVERGHRDAGRWLRVAERDGRPCGYQVARPPGGDGVGRLELLGVAEAARGQGIGLWLLGNTMRHLAEAGATSIVTVMQIRNIPSIRLHERIGFLTERVESWYHRWLD